MKWLIPIGIGLISLWIGLRLPRIKPPPERVRESIPLSTPEGGTGIRSVEPEAKERLAEANPARLEAEKKLLMELQAERAGIENSWRRGGADALTQKRAELERLQIKLKSRVGVGEKDGSVHSESGEESWRDQRARELVDLNRQLSELETRLHQVKGEIKKNPTAELEAARASLKAEHRILISRRDQAKSELGAESLKTKKMSSKERTERRQWRNELTGRIRNLQLEIKALEKDEGSGEADRQRRLESKLSEIDQKISECRSRIEALESVQSR